MMIRSSAVPLVDERKDAKIMACRCRAPEIRKTSQSCACWLSILEVPRLGTLHEASLMICVENRCDRWPP